MNTDQYNQALCFLVLFIWSINSMGSWKHLLNLLRNWLNPKLNEIDKKPSRINNAIIFVSSHFFTETGKIHQIVQSKKLTSHNPKSSLGLQSLLTRKQYLFYPRSSVNGLWFSYDTVSLFLIDEIAFWI